MNDDSDNIVFENQRFLSVRFFGTDISLERVESICSVLDCGVWTIFWNLYLIKRRTGTMVDIKKEQERDELHRAIWAIADELRGAAVRSFKLLRSQRGLGHLCGKYRLYL